MNSKVKVRDPFTGKWTAALLLRKGRTYTVQLTNGTVLNVPANKVRKGR